RQASDRARLRRNRQRLRECTRFSNRARLGDGGRVKDRIANTAPKLVSRALGLSVFWKAQGEHAVLSGGHRFNNDRLTGEPLAPGLFPPGEAFGVWHELKMRLAREHLGDH